ncbi:sensor domain-containing diguanylate cyclase [Rhodospirillum centenum]|uniref:diguanylate cyclase n=1 Tax=Rhodospirillum centenum (strain ATCC 51521 / SW) TaxID=414684 RepID=B6IWW6_RHOCS|nr:GGDEF domain-containing protein [Rhodospirillum centenum]ACJ00790.1 diguanylate cyclase, putative [Rhodospirillum centenum SW]
MVGSLHAFDGTAEQRFEAWRCERLRDLLPTPIVIGALALVGFTLWDWVLHPASLPWALAIRLAAAAAMLWSAWRIAADAEAPLRPLTILALTTGVGAVALTQALAPGGFDYGTAGLVLFPTVSAVAAPRARDVPVLNLAPAVVVLTVLLASGAGGFTLGNVLAHFGTGLFTAYVVALALERAARQSFALELRLEEEARIDPLTGLANRRRLEEQADLEVERARRFGRPLSVLMLDLDHFKRVNDEHGHARGDALMSALATLCRRALRQTDLFARAGGDEFVALLPETALDDATTLAERLRTLVEAEPLLRGPVPVGATVSIGVATYVAHGRSWAAMLQAADDALYRAKAAGRNRVETAPEAGDGWSRAGGPSSRHGSAGLAAC